MEKEQETLEEAAEKYVGGGIYLNEPEKQQTEIAFYKGAKWQQERMYSQDEVKDIIEQTIEKFYKHTYADKTKAEMKELWFEQFKKK